MIQNALKPHAFLRCNVNIRFFIDTARLVCMFGDPYLLPSPTVVHEKQALSFIASRVNPVFNDGAAV